MHQVFLELSILGVLIIMASYTKCMTWCNDKNLFSPQFAASFNSHKASLAHLDVPSLYWISS